MTKKPLVPETFQVPAVLETEHFRLRMLSVEDVEKDYEAVIESQSLLHTMFGGPWPRDGFTLAENLADLERHQQEFLDRIAFAYTIVSLDEIKVLGCLYINPPRKTNADAEIRMWVRLPLFTPPMRPSRAFVPTRPGTGRRRCARRPGRRRTG